MVAAVSVLPLVTPCLWHASDGPADDMCDRHCFDCAPQGAVVDNNDDNASCLSCTLLQITITAHPPSSKVISVNTLITE